MAGSGLVWVVGSGGQDCGGRADKDFSGIRAAGGHVLQAALTGYPGQHPHGDIIPYRRCVERGVVLRCCYCCSTEAEHDDVFKFPASPTTKKEKSNESNKAS